MPVRTLRYDQISLFKRSWPCHGLPDELDRIVVETDGIGDVVDIEAYVHKDGEEHPVEWREFDGAAFSALVQDCVSFGERPESARTPVPSP